MTERSAASVQRSRDEFVVGPSRVHWDGNALTIEIDERGMPIPHRVRGRVRVFPRGLSRFVAALDDAGAHRWGPIAPCSRVEVEMDQPGARWSGHAYLDSNEGDEPIERPFVEWDWSRATLADDSTAVIYDVRQREGGDRVIAARFAPDGSAEPFEAPPRRPLPTSAWRIGRTQRSEDAPRLAQTLEDTPFYVRSLVDARLLGQPVSAVHETLAIPRLTAATTQWMLPWRMPRVR